ncbi:hypothetical protein [Mycobacterium tuberculosis]|uniref:hypothetical protein n=1 Tax=Mycobacterium tuberculosis TaxID=1773 RepID=UPI0028763CF9|nr:hypothetical protein [Mycobacterium tuberculosis]MDS0320887.1 hypothetical protein [Mycobacterium tuberculosis]
MTNYRMFTPTITTGDMHGLTNRFNGITESASRQRIKRMRLDIMLEDIELLYGPDAVKSHPIVSQLYETVKQSREEVS